jgi:hypothetical protein
VFYPEPIFVHNHIMKTTYMLQVTDKLYHIMKTTDMLQVTDKLYHIMKTTDMLQVTDKDQIIYFCNFIFFPLKFDDRIFKMPRHHHESYIIFTNVFWFVKQTSVSINTHVMYNDLATRSWSAYQVLKTNTQVRWLYNYFIVLILNGKNMQQTSK